MFKPQENLNEQSSKKSRNKSGSSSTSSHFNKKLGKWLRQSHLNSDERDYIFNCVKNFPKEVVKIIKSFDSPRFINIDEGFEIKCDDYNIKFVVEDGVLSVAKRNIVYLSYNTDIHKN